MKTVNKGSRRSSKSRGSRASQQREEERAGEDSQSSHTARKGTAVCKLDFKDISSHNIKHY